MTVSGPYTHDREDRGKEPAQLKDATLESAGQI